MSNVLKKMGRMGAAVVLALVVAAGACQAAVIANLSLDVDQGTQEWYAYLTLTDPSSETLGLNGIYLDAWGSETEFGPWTGGLAVNDGTDPLGWIVLPSGSSPSFPPSWAIGFSSLAQPGAVVGTGIELMGVMQASTHRANTKSGVTYNSILKGVGETSGSAPVSGGTVEWDYPVLVAQGMYTGTAGWINVSLRKDALGTVTSMTVLPATLPTATTGGAAFNTFSPTAGGDYRVSFYVPEPATLALLAFGGLGMFLSRKRK